MLARKIRWGESQDEMLSEEDSFPCTDRLSCLEGGVQISRSSDSYLFISYWSIIMFYHRPESHCIAFALS